MHRSASRGDFATTPTLPSTAAAYDRFPWLTLFASLPPLSPALLWLQPALRFPTILNYKVLTLKQLENDKYLIYESL